MTAGKKKTDALTIGELAERSGLSVTAIRFYESKDLISSNRSPGGQRRFPRSSLRRLSFVKISQNLGFSLGDIREAMATLPDSRTPSKRDWEILSQHFVADIDRRIAGLEQLRENLTSCIGCGCLSLARCRLYNPQDEASGFGQGPRFLMGDRPEKT
ncbi:redox-sensitive transcriptional activator SoxR [Granulosicoccus antarcticus]|uniref:Redox-sensitive transcriptional activator SoxR n=1 Tax=Granulosicoccus antarcticus IMCC3135 TaxID=1192854 RepID=A0A2Z2NU45_9GAMM|nr:redox-sensitive transcriptional activator SoxR [Granulosicoccus antarcticus]ASJ74783.1 Redox-sensitive transcriptional activator SoxR [Granulosicoccus antarcticus IMCC3135]